MVCKKSGIKNIKHFVSYIKIINFWIERNKRDNKYKKNNDANITNEYVSKTIFWHVEILKYPYIYYIETKRYSNIEKKVEKKN